MNYKEFLESKLSQSSDIAIDITDDKINNNLFDFQKDIVKWALKKGCSAIFADCGLGKTPMQLEWAQKIVEKTNKPVLILTPLAVAAQTIREGKKFGIECGRSSGENIKEKIVITNYEKLEHFYKGNFSGVVCDESSILKSFDGARKQQITEFMKKIPYRLLATATAAPNDYIELGTSSECLGYLGFMDMLNKFFKNEQGSSGLHRHGGEPAKWRFKGHSEIPFWRWVTFWARACRKPSDLGYSDEKFILPDLIENYHLVHTEKKPEGMLFNLPANDLRTQREERNRTIQERCEQVYKLVVHTGKPALVWCHLNEEGDTLEKMIPDSIQISGKEKDERKEEKFMEFINGKARVLITKPKIGAWGLNFQHCAHITYFPTHSYESYYQAVRRCWRFGQKNKVRVDIIHTEGERKVMENMRRKMLLAEKMFENLVNEMNRAEKIDRKNIYIEKEVLPQWL